MCFESPTSVLPLPKNAVRMASAAAKARSRRGVSDTPAASFEKMLPLVLRPRADQISNSISCPWPLQNRDDQLPAVKGLVHRAHHKLELPLLPLAASQRELFESVFLCEAASGKTHASSTFSG